MRLDQAAVNATRSAAPHARKLIGHVLAGALAPQPIATLAQSRPIPISDVPIGVGASSVVKPNFMFILEDSGSMNWEFMPGERSAFYNNSAGLYSNRCNTIYYNPAVTHEAPPHPDDPLARTLSVPSGAALVPRDGFSANGYGSNTEPAVNLNSFRLDNVDDPRWSPTPAIAAQAPFYVEWIGAGEPTADDCKYTSVDSLASGADPKWRKQAVTDRANFAMWHAYYRTRLAVMKIASARAFAGLDNGLRVGPSTINPMIDLGETYGAVDMNKFLAIANFNAAQKTAWIAKLYRMTAAGDTPLREALSRVGRHYGGKNDDINLGINDDPVQYSCQRNYALLTTDGYWTDDSHRPVFGNGRDLAAQTANIDEDSDPSLPASIRDDFRADFRTRTSTYTSTGAIEDQRNEPAELARCEAEFGVTRQPLAATGACSYYNNIYVLQRTEVSSGNIQWRPQGYNLDWADFSLLYSGDSVPGLPTVPYGSRYLPGVCCVLQSGRAVTASDGIGVSCTITTLRDTLPPPGPPTLSDWSAPVSLDMHGSGMLADTALYYFQKNLRSGTAGGEPRNRQSGRLVSTPDPTAAQLQSETDIAEHQRMLTYTMGFGVSGRVTSDPSYRVQTASSTPHDFNDLRNRTGNKGWLFRSAGNEAKIDDLWHAAINGRGSYFSAGTAEDVIDARETTLAEINGRNAGGAAVGLSNIEPTAASNYVYVPQYYDAKWRGDLVRKRVNTDTGAIGDPEGSAAAKLAAAVKSNCDNRKIWLMSGATLSDFSWSSYKCDSSGAKGDVRADGLSADQKVLFSTATSYPNLRGRNGVVPRPEALVNFLRGRSADERCQRTGVFRCRESSLEGKQVLGDIVGSQPVYVKAPFFNYSENNDRASFKAAHTDGVDAEGRVVRNGCGPTLYVGANDGMLHAFDAETMAERWAIIPSAMWPSGASEPGLARLAARSYGTNHRFFVDATPTVGDVFDGTAWRTILIGGFNAGGTGYFAIDVTDPNAPRALWEFSNADLAVGEQHLGMSYGNPIITKRDGDQRWVAVVASGYNSPTGRGVVYTLDALTGRVLTTIDTAVGTAADQAGLAKLSAWSEDTLTDNTTRYVYGGDLKGNLWRFDIRSDATTTKFKVAELANATRNAQPITAAPELGRNGATRYVFVATGKLLHEDDLESTSTQSVYAIVDTLSTSSDSAAVIRRAGLSECRLTSSGETRTSACTGDAASGWFVDLTASERVVYHPRLQLGTLVFASGVPSDDICRGGGSTYLHYVDFRSGLALPSADGGKVAHRTAGGLASGLVLVRLPGGAIRAIVTTMEGVVVSEGIPIPASAGGGKRVAWREVGN